MDVWISSCHNSLILIHFDVDIFEIDPLLDNLPRDPGKAAPPLNEGRRPGGKGEICGNGREEGGRGTCGRGPGNME